MVASYTHKSSILSFFLIFLAILMSSRCWIGFEGRSVFFNYLLPVALLFCVCTGRFYIKRSARHFIFVCLIYIVKLYTVYKVRGTIDIVSIVNQAVFPLTIYLILCSRDDEKDRMLGCFIKWLGLILIPSIILYIITMFVNLPSFGILQTHYGGDFYGDPCKNYVFYIKPISVAYPRFNGPFIEPGDLGCLSAFILFSARYNFKKYKYLWVVFFGLILSFSLAGYMLTLFGYFAIQLNSGKLSISKFIVGGVVVLCIYLFGVYYNGGENLVNQSILSRLGDDNFDVGNANGRTSEEKMEYFYFMLNDISLFLFGYSKDVVDRLSEVAMGAGVFNQMISVGFIGIILSLLPFIYFSLTSKTKYSALYLAFLILYSYQRFDLFLYGVTICYVYGIVIHEKQINK